MTKKINNIYKCNICGNIVEMVHTGDGALVCCGQDMALLDSNTVETATEKHIPAMEMVGEKIVVKIGSVEHPMLVEHYIEWVEVITNAGLCRKTFAPGEKPFAEFTLKEEATEVRAYCNIHGLWSSTK